MRGSGKTSIAKAVAEHLSRRHIDLDAVITQKVGCSVQDFVTAKGRDAFRDEEYMCLGDVLQIPGKKIISLGGGTITFVRNQRLLLRHNTQLISIQTSLDRIVERMQQADNAHRPSLTGK